MKEQICSAKLSEEEVCELAPANNAAARAKVPKDQYFTIVLKNGFFGLFQ